MTSYGYRGVAALAQTALASVTGALIYALWNMPSSAFGWEFLLWLAVVGGATIPIAFVGIVLVRLLSISGWRRAPILTLGCLVGIVVSTYIFEFYMAELFPAINWSRGALLPAASFMSGFVLAVLQWPRFADRENDLVAGSA
jgi:hypothetical protein